MGGAGAMATLAPHCPELRSSRHSLEAALKGASGYMANDAFGIVLLALSAQGSERVSMIGLPPDCISSLVTGPAFFAAREPRAAQPGHAGPEIFSGDFQQIPIIYLLH